MIGKLAHSGCRFISCLGYGTVECRSIRNGFSVGDELCHWTILQGECALFRIEKCVWRPFWRICTRPASLLSQIYFSSLRVHASSNLRWAYRLVLQLCASNKSVKTSFTWPQARVVEVRQMSNKPLCNVLKLVITLQYFCGAIQCMMQLCVCVTLSSYL